MQMSTFKHLDAACIHKHLAFVFKDSHPVFESVVLYIGVVCGKCHVLISFNSDVCCDYHHDVVNLRLGNMCIADV